MMKYFWVRVFDSSKEDDAWDQGTMLDEFYLICESREEAKQEVRNRYQGQAKEQLKFAKPRKSNGIYAIVMDSDKYFYDRFYLTIDTYCFNCHTKISGQESFFPRTYIDGYEEIPAYFCGPPCKWEMRKKTDPSIEGDFQDREEGKNGEVFGYIYLIYNRMDNMYYVGQTRYLPFFRWQDHVKAGEKGDIKDMTFSVLAEIRKRKSKSDEENRQYLNNVEAWWIAKYEAEGFAIKNVTKPLFTIVEMKERFAEMVGNQVTMF